MEKEEFITEILEKINEDPKLLYSYIQHSTYAQHVIKVLRYSYDPQLKMNLPEGTPDYIPSDAPDISLAYGNFYYEQKSWNIWLTEWNELGQEKANNSFIQLLEGLHPDEATLMIHIKDQTLDKLYPNITANLVKAAGIITDEIVDKFQKGRAASFRGYDLDNLGSHNKPKDEKNDSGQKLSNIEKIKSVYNNNQ